MTIEEIRSLHMSHDWHTEIRIWGVFNKQGQSSRAEGLPGRVATISLDSQGEDDPPAIKVAIYDDHWRPEWGESGSKTWFNVADIERIEITEAVCERCFDDVEVGAWLCEACAKG